LGTVTPRRPLAPQNMSRQKFFCRRCAVDLAVVLLLAGMAGCGGPDPLKSPAAARLKGLATMYLDFAAAQGTGPPNEEAFRKHLKKVERFVLEMNGVDPKAIDDSFISPRDKQPFVIIYGVGIGQISGTSAPVVAYEKTGVNGRRLVAFANTKLDHVDDARLEELKSKK
jgi:hypothetical protein